MCKDSNCNDCPCGKDKKSISKTKGETISKQKEGEIGKPKETFEK